MAGESTASREKDEEDGAATPFRPSCSFPSYHLLCSSPVSPSLSRKLTTEGSRRVVLVNIIGKCVSHATSRKIHLGIRNMFQAHCNDLVHLFFLCVTLLFAFHHCSFIDYGLFIQPFVKKKGNWKRLVATMPEHRSQHHDKGKEVAHQQNDAKRCFIAAPPCTSTGFIIREPPNNTCVSYSSSDEDMPNSLPTISPARSILKSLGRFEQGECSKEPKRPREGLCYASFAQSRMEASDSELTKCTPDQRLATDDRTCRQSLTPEERREQINSHRRACYQNLTPEERERINAHKRARHQNLTLEEKEKVNARKRAWRQSLTSKQREEANARRRAARHSLTLEERNARQRERRRARRQSLPPHERQALLDKRNESYAVRRDTPCKESIALQSSTSSLVGYRASNSCASECQNMATQTFATTQGNLESIREETEEEQVVYVSPGINDITMCTELASVRCPTSEAVDSLLLGPNEFNRPYCPAESFVTEDNDDTNSNVSEEQDDEYFIFAGRGTVGHGYLFISPHRGSFTRKQNR
ncbi:hypothetical protein EJB05_16363 [Eragrostis curvula]|uniref:Uncharacterized protein n=1 Tax=Eragrostis curvula TaxID=38414 RepID=A0A5J9VFR2_9POAL|nr:hypothetical protein EJB05_16363 [Eragrostis curvula]